MKNFFHSLFPTKEQLNDLKLRNRMRLASFSVFLIWLCSLKTATYLATYSIEVPPIQMLHRSCHATYDVVQDEREKFTQCAKTQLNQCEASLSKMAQDEYSRVDEASKQNSETNAAIDKVAKTCLEDYDGLTNILKQWSKAGNEVPIKQSVCTEQEKKLLLNSIVSVDSLKSRAFQVSETYRRESEAVVTDLIEYTKIRMDYDRRYIMNNTDLVEGFFETNLPRPRVDFTSQIEHARNSFQAWTDCMNIATEKNCSLDLPTDLIVQFHNEVNQRGEEYIKAMQAHYTRSYDRIVALHDNIVEKATNIYNFFKAGKKFMEWIMDNDSKAANDYELFREPFRSFVLDKFGDMVDQLKSFEANMNISGSLSEVLSKVYEDEIKERAGNAYNFLNDEVTSGFNNFEAEFASWLDSVQSNFDFDKVDFFVDYNPPTYGGVNPNLTSMDEEKASFQKNGEEFISRSSEALHKIANATAASIKHSNQTRKKWSRANYTSFKSGLQNKSLNLLKPSKPKFSIDGMFLKALSMRDILFLVDFGFRIYFSIRLFFKYWSVSSIKLPEIDVRTEKDFHTMNPLKWSYGKFIFTVIVNPITGMLLGLVLVTLIIRFASDIVFPLVADYEKGCVANGVEGTFLSANLYSFAYNFAYNDGSSILVDGLKNLETQRTNLCFDNVSPSVTKYNDDLSYFNQTMLMVSTLGRQFDKYSECVDTNTFDNQISTACCQNIDFVDDAIHSCSETLNQSMTCPIDSNYSTFTLPGEYITRHSCNTDQSNEFYTIRNSVYDCAALKSCDVTCSGPHKETIKQFSKQCSCVSEWTFHSFWLRTILALLIFVIMNTSRKIIVDGLAMLFWKHLHPGTFAVCFTCNSDGTIRIGGTVKSWNERHSISSVESSREIKEGSEALILTDEIKRQILWNSFKFQMTGILLILGALSMNALWIGVALRVNDNLRLHWL